MDRVYLKLAERLKCPESQHLLTILQKIMTPEEGKFLLELKLSPAELDKQLISAKNPDKKLLDLWRRGLIWADAEEGAFFPRGPIFLHDLYFTLEEVDPAVVALWKDWYDTEWCKLLSQTFAGKDGRINNRLIPTVKSLNAFRKNNKDAVLPYEDPEQILKGCDTIALRHYCVCRRMLSCQHPTDTCLQFNQYGEYDISRDMARKISVDEAMAILDRSAENGLVHLVPNKAEIKKIRSICNCCSCSCFIINSTIKWGTLQNAIAKTRYQAAVNSELCTGCKKCVNRCNFGAIDMVKTDNPKKFKAQINLDKCWGCGVCYSACKREAISLKLVRPVEHIPFADDTKTTVM